MFKYGIIQLLSDAEKVTFQWKDEPGWSLNFLEKYPLSIDALFLTHFTCITPSSPNPVYLITTWLVMNCLTTLTRLKMTFIAQKIH
jgi:hypothetical protein